MTHKLRVGLAGLGYRGSYLLKMLQTMPELVELVGIADPALQGRQCHEGIKVYAEGARSHEALINATEPELLIIASPWHCHIAQALYALEHGCHVALEIKPGISTTGEESEYTPLYDASARNERRVFPLENAVFFREVLAVWRMVEEGIFGQLVHLRGGYRHDLRRILIDDSGHPRQSGEGSWRYAYYHGANADIYPTHGLAPIALMAGLGRNDRIQSLYSQGSIAQGLADYLSPEAYTQGKAEGGFISDIITTHIRSERGILLNLIHDTTLPRPRSLDWEVQGTRGIWEGDKRRIYIQGQSPEESWEDDIAYIERYEHPLWQAWGAKALEVDAHHQGMDYIMLRTLVADLRGEAEYPMTLDDLVLWCSITPLSAESIRRGEVLHFP
ncbi:MAG: Gfo/Idh/MocA family oxidoreductase [Porphyromonas sp.]|nr:Gfo/Idh/MocA family oxidoreductase [Porphyromonas sp.]